jgi:hypothetical protein
MSIEAMQQALEALEAVRWSRHLEDARTIAKNARNALRQAIEEAEKPPIYIERATTNYEDGWEEGFKAGSLSKQTQKQEPYGWVHAKVSGTFYKEKPRRIHTTPVYTVPTRKEWVKLTELEIAHGLEKANLPAIFSYRAAARAGIDAFKEKNT